ncbi:hypothetical protein LSAT2_028396 [Lamellibrachia satsuma]|nr:hypothetical protein LSAT2_028396 [Lamellibrachia satsuma]
MVLRFCVLVFVLGATLRAQNNELATSRHWTIQPKDVTNETPIRTLPNAESQDVTQTIYQRGSMQTKGSTPLHENALASTASPQQTAEIEDTLHDESNTNLGRISETQRVPHNENDSVSHTTGTNTYSNQTAETTVPDTELWLKVLVKFQLFLSVVGYIANTVTFIALVRNGDIFSSDICLLLKHQALVDSWICAMGTILLLQPPMWTTGNTHFDAAVCYFWHGQAPFWGAIMLSVWNLASIAVERYMAVCLPFKHSQFKTTFSQYSIAAMYIANPIITLPSFVQVRFENGVCLSEFIIQGPTGEKLFFAYCLVWFIAVYLLPVTAYVYLYGSVVFTLYRRKNSTAMSCSKVIDTAQSTITKTAITLTGIFLFAIGFDAWAYVLGYTGVVEYEFGSAKQKVEPKCSTSGKQTWICRIFISK